MSLIFVLGLSFSLVHLVQAQSDFGLGAGGVGDNINLSEASPFDVATKIINIALGFLGLIAVVLIIYGGFVWMTSGGAADKVDQAKRILKNSIIGLVIILSAWGIVSFVITQLIDATGGNNNGNEICSTGQSLACGCELSGSMDCIDNTWGPCLGANEANCSLGDTPTSCDGSNILGGCQATDQMCSINSYCDEECLCQPKGELGDSCDVDQETPVCDAEESLCSEYLNCDPTSCTCYGPPIIMAISPVGGFCEEDENLSCDSNTDCASSCNQLSPNGAFDNLITISGVNFGEYGPSSKVVFGGEVDGVSPSVLNSACVDSWTNNQIIIAVPPGATTGHLQVITATGDSDYTDDVDNGPILPNFVVNKISRPGLCSLTPETGLLSQQVTYQGFNLYNGEAYFGNYLKKVKGLDSSFENPAGLIGTTTIPNLSNGQMSSFVTVSIYGKEQKSNYVNFVKEAEPDAGPYISYFEPTTGRAGQYVTIHGSGFGNAQGFSQVFFETIEASYDFPLVCSDSVWSDDQIIVKVPSNLEDGDYTLKINLTASEITSQNANPNTFEADDEASLQTSICKISPTRGQIGMSVNIWGEYFGEVGGNANVKFSKDKSAVSVISADQSAKKLEPIVPENAVTGPVTVLKGGVGGNSVNFEVGACASDDECGDDYCCPSTTYKKGQCVDSLNDCYSSIPTSVFEWNFTTGFGSVVTPQTYDSCQGMAQALGACQVNSFCPNSPGLCSPFDAGIQNLGSCDDSCDSLANCSSGTCNYDISSDKCVLNNYNCSLNSILNYDLDGVAFSAVKSCKISPLTNLAHWEIQVATSCPDDWTMMNGNLCVDFESECNLCEAGFECQQVGNEGRCVTEELCPGSANCGGSSCVIETSARCDCCCEIGESARDCCAPLICGGTCGSDTSDDNDGFGQCSGCAIDSNGDNTFSPEEKTLSDEACNCSNSSGKYCDVSTPTGTCVDCSLLSPTSCVEHSATCCLDSNNTEDSTDDVCRGGSGLIVSNDPNDTANFGYCAYYSCNDDGSGNCNTIPQKEGAFSTIATCDNTCSVTPDFSFCGQYDNLEDCSATTDCCYDSASNLCEGGDQTSTGYCDYFNCESTANGLQECNGTPLYAGDYENYQDCLTGCSQPSISSVGQSCTNLNSSNSVAEICNNNFCATPFACLSDPSLDGVNNDCGVCCCQVSDPNDPPAQDSCAGVGNGDLICQPNQTPCSGDDRGLCCGCSADSDCENPANTIGCDSGACCRARPVIIANDVVPESGSTDVCRNASISIPFNQSMDIVSLKNNIILLEEHDYADGVCPTGTFLASATDTEFIAPKQNWLIRVYSRLNRSVRGVLRNLGLSSHTALAIAPPAFDKLYCVVPGNISSSNNGSGTVAEFTPKKVLAADTSYYLVVKGDEILDSSTGVLSQWQLGMNGDGFLSGPTYSEGINFSFNNLVFANSYISGFVTLPDQGVSSGICLIDYVKTDPSSYLFQHSENSLSEDDSKVNSDSFDTENDSDKLFKARAYSSDNQLLHPSSGYDWEWVWGTDDDNIAYLVSPNPDNLDNDQAFVRAANNISDDETVLSAKVDMSSFSTTNFSLDGDALTSNTPLFVFLCENPWPAVNPLTLTWSPWTDQAGAGYANYNYKFYYCRDAGADGLVDDLPAMNPGFNLGPNLLCSTDQSSCSSAGATCGPGNNGVCLWNILKESYFFKAAAPQAGTITGSTAASYGTAVILNWSGNSDLIYSTTATQMGKYRIYYAPLSAGQMSFIDVAPNDTVKGVPVCSPATPAAGTNYICSYNITGLQAGTTYRFKVSAISAAQVESPLSNEEIVSVIDTAQPNEPANLAGEVIGNQLQFSWWANTDDALFYRLYYGVNTGQYGASYDSADNATTLNLNINQFNPGTYHFALTAIDASGNESAKSNEIVLTTP